MIKIKKLNSYKIQTPPIAISQPLLHFDFLYIKNNNTINNKIKVVLGTFIYFSVVGFSTDD